MSNERQAKRASLITVAGVPGFWARKNAAAKKSQTRKVWDGGSLEPTVMADPAEVDSITLSRPFDYSRDWPVMQSLLAKVGMWDTTITEVPTDPALAARSAKLTYSVKLTGVNTLEVDASSGDAQELTLTFDVRDVK